MNATVLVLFVVGWGVASCGDDESTACVPGDPCPGGWVCAEVRGGEPACFARVRIEGTVTDSTTGDGISHARVVALDASSSACSDAVDSGPDGAWSVEVQAVRDAEGKPLTFPVTLRVDAAGFLSFPLPPRTALPVDLADAVKTGDVWVVRSAATEVVLIPLAGPLGVTVEGSVGGDDPDGVLVLAEVGGRAVATAITDLAGEFRLFNVPAGSVSLRGVKAGVAAGPVTIEVESDDVTGVTLPVTEATGVVRGSINLVDVGDAETKQTSVVLVPDSTFVAAAGRGEVPAGLRAAGVKSAFQIDAVPPGRYAVLAAFENDGLVRDPDLWIAGTEIRRVDVTPGGDADAGVFKVTAALGVMSPGKDGMEDISDPEPLLAWTDDSSEDGYEVRVFDAQGNLVHEDKAVPRVTGGFRVDYKWTGAAMAEGGIYQFRAASYREDPRGNRTFISTTEDLTGVFRFVPAP